MCEHSSEEIRFKDGTKKALSAYIRFFQQTGIGNAIVIVKVVTYQEAKLGVHLQDDLVLSRRAQHA